MAKLVRVINSSRDMELGDRIILADTFWSRAKGLLGRDSLSRGEGLLLVPCQHIHMFFMKISLDVLFLDGCRRILATFPSLSPNKTIKIKGAVYVLEVPVGVIEASKSTPGDTLVWL